MIGLRKTNNIIFRYFSNRYPVCDVQYNIIIALIYL